MTHLTALKKSHRLVNISKIEKMKKNYIFPPLFLFGHQSQLMSEKSYKNNLQG